jgi:hypothetical protein
MADNLAGASTQFMRGALRYRNLAGLTVIASLVQALDRATACLQADSDSLGFMVIVDPEFQSMWDARAAERMNAIQDARAVAGIIREATVRAQDDLDGEKC